jgi:hypothetical protein
LAFGISYNDWLMEKKEADEQREETLAKQVRITNKLKTTFLFTLIGIIQSSKICPQANESQTGF